jgi:hypothetical protein
VTTIPAYDQKNKFLECVEPIHIQDFSLLGFPIDTVCNPALEIEGGYSISLN